ncbi:MAG TPA: hemolysin family protein [Kineosporiaceae bacterium]|nr:hemolysin family protein [Kineosporiaceae bacterium]
MSPASALGLALVLLLLNAFFVGAEFAVISARRSQIEPLADAGRRAARTTLWAMEHVSLMLACSQLGITVCSLGLGAVAEPAIVHLLEVPFGALGLPPGVLHPIAFALALGVVIYFHVVVGEMVPKNLAIAGPERAALLLAPPLVGIGRGLSPLIKLLTAVTNGLLRLIRVEPKEELTSAFTAEEVHSIVTESRREGLLEDEHNLLTGALELGERRAGDVMVPWDRLITVPVGSTPAEVEALVARTGFSRFPVVTFSDRAGGPAVTDGERPSAEADVVGYLHLKDLLYADDGQHELPVPDKRVRALVTVGALDEVEDVLAAMQRSGAHLARVVDENGATAGVVFLEDVLEELVGEVRDATQRPVIRSTITEPQVTVP